MKLLQDDLIPYAIVNALDKSVANFTNEELSEAALLFQHQKYDEREFFYNFKQVNQPHFHFAPDDSYYYQNLTPPKGKINKDARKLFFTSLLVLSRTYWTKYTLYKAFHLANLFVALSSDYRYIVQTAVLIRKINSLYDDVNPPFGFNQRRNYIIYKNLPSELYVDLITFLQVEIMPFKFRLTMISGTESITEIQIKSVMQDFGLENVSDLVIDQGLTGFDKFHRRKYNAMQVIRILITIRSAAAEIKRNMRTIDQRQYITNTSPFREFPGPIRRLANSTLV